VPRQPRVPRLHLRGAANFYKPVCCKGTSHKKHRWLVAFCAFYFRQTVPFLKSQF
jgi:hypothetical protein